MIDLYMKFGDGLNCIAYPYKSVAKMLQHYTVEDLSAVYYFVKEALTSKKWRKRLSKLAVKTIHGTDTTVSGGCI